MTADLSLQSRRSETFAPGGTAQHRGGMQRSDNITCAPQLDFEGWRELVRTICGRYNPEGPEPNTFTGWVRRSAGSRRRILAVTLVGSSGPITILA